MGKPRAPHKPSLGILFWIAAILLISIVLMFSLPSIREVLETTGFIDVVFEDTPREPETVVTAPPEEDTVEPAPTTEEQEQPEMAVPEESGPDEDPDEDPGEVTDEEREEIELVSPPTEERTMRTTVYLIRVADDGRIIAEAVPRTIRFTQSPLTQTLEVLLSGPDADDLNRGLLSLIPTGSRLLAARVEENVAYLSFNEEFRFNSMGLEGHLAQLQQVVLTATTFSTVDAVQILIEGHRIDYLGGDGVYIGRPLTSADFRS